ncbi:Transcription factor RAX2 [Linum perenne]
MGRAPCCYKANVKKAPPPPPPPPEEDAKLKSYIYQHGTSSNWISLPHKLVLSSSSSRLIYLSIPLSEYNYTFL